MSAFLDQLKARLADAQQRLQASQLKLAQVQAEHNTVMMEFTSWQNAVNVEARKEQLAVVTVPVNPAAGATKPALPATTPASPLGVHQQVNTNGSGNTKVNQVDLVRAVLRQHPNGITPVAVWKQLGDRVGRAYVYSILKRLRDSDQAQRRRGKYVLVVGAKSEETKDQLTF
jgi:hypothetical protein